MATGAQPTAKGVDLSGASLNEGKTSLSAAQTRLWSWETVFPAARSHGLGVRMQFQGGLDVGRLEAALNELVRRTTSLRLGLTTASGKPACEVIPHHAITLAPREERGARGESAGGTAPDTTVPRARLVRVDESNHVLEVALSEIGISRGTLPGFYRELVELYADRPLKDNDVQNTPGPRERGACPKAAPQLNLPFDQARPPVMTFQAEQETFPLSTELCRKLPARSEALEAVLTTAVAVLLHRYSGQEEIVLGSNAPAWGESKSGIREPANPTVFRYRISADDPFGSVLSQVRAAAMAGDDDTVQTLTPGAELSCHPVFQVGVEFLDEFPRFELPGVVVEGSEVAAGGSKLDLVFVFRKAGEGVEGSLEYKSELFRKETARGMTEHLCVLLEALGQDEKQPVGRVPILAAKEQRRLLKEWNATRAPFEDKGTHQLFEAQASRTPGATALVFGEKTWTYRELNEQAGRLAQVLRQRGVRPDTLVGVCVERSPAMLLSQLAILKAGGAYVPLDPTYPRERLAFMAADADLQLLITQNRFADTFTVTPESILCIDSFDWESGEIAPPAESAPESLAYVIYTSGSTGKPKGVMISHRNVANFFAGMDAVIGRETGVWLAVTSICFDISVLELFWTLCRGFKVVLQPDRHVSDDSVAAQIVRHGVTHFQCTPSLAGMLLAEPNGLEALRRVRKVLLGGEPLPAWLADKLSDAVELINVYGPTETTVWSAATSVRPGAAITIGRPLANTQIYILDANLQLVPAGVPGEIFIGGIGVARGYLKRAQLTAERFVPNPFAAQPGERIYRTGDRGKYLPDGRIECLGRVDYQLKVRGFRIEPGEIENRLREHPAVQEAVVVSRDYTAGDKRLVAYYVGKSQATDADLRQFLKERLPDYMVPSAFVQLAALPLTPNGKVDRNRLPAPDFGPGKAGVALGTPHEKAVAALWRTILGVEDVRGDSNFFALGGDAIKAWKLQQELSGRLGVAVPVLRLLQHPVLSAQAEAIGEATAAEEGEVEWWPLTEGQKEVWLISQKSDAASCIFNISRLLRIRGAVESNRLAASMQRIVDRHESLRVTFKADGSSQRVVRRMAAEIRGEDWSGYGADERSRRLEALLRAEAEQAFDLLSGPLVRWRWVRTSEVEHIVVLTTHHLVADGESAEMALKELVALSAGEELAPPVTWRAFLAGQNKSGKNAGSPGTAFWLEQYPESMAPAELPVDHARPSAPTFRGGLASRLIPAELSQRLQGCAREQEWSLAGLLSAAYGVFIRKLTGQTDVVIGLRVQGDEGVVADKIRFVPLRLRGEDEETFEALAARSEALCQAARTHSTFTLGTLARQLTELGHAERVPAVNVALAVRETAWGARFGELDATLSRNPYLYTNLDFDLEVATGEGDWEMHGVFNRDVLEAETVQRWMQHFHTLLEQIVRKPSARLCDLSLLSEAERRQITYDWNATELDYPREFCMHQCFEMQAAARPEAVALVSGERSLTYGELNARANQLARYLIKRGARRDGLIGVWVDRSEELLVALLGVLKSGAAYLPLDAGYPRERLQYMLQDTGAALLLTQSHWLPHLPPHGAQTICLDAAGEEIALEDKANPSVAHAPHHLGYVIYTSGSTGRPKGVAIEHSCAASFVHWAREVFTAAELGGTLASTSICFDLSIFELFVPLSWGGTVILAENIMQLAHLPARERVTLVNTVPSAAGDLLRTGAIPGSVTTFALAGEPLTPRMVEDLYALGHVKKVYDLYGPSETTTYSTFTLRQSGARATVGKPLANTQVYILDAGLQPTPIGVPGEICIGGAGVARGYLNAAEATAQKFVADPFRSGSRMYRTGDLGRWLPQGELEFLGRRDFQVKIRGYRIELGEIETAMSAHPAVREVAAVARGENVLAGYAVVDAQSDLTTNELRHYLRQKLPDYMVPTALMFLEAMPRTPSGKVDRKALPAPIVETSADPAAAAEEMSPIEETLARIWQEVIGIERVGVADNFFDLGGHSVLVVQVMARVRAAFQVDLTLRNVFEAPTVGELARVVEEKLIEQIEGMPETMMEEA